MNPVVVVLMMTLCAGQVAPFPDPANSFSEKVNRQLNDGNQPSDSGSTLRNMCDQLNAFKTSMASVPTTQAKNSVLDTPLPLPNLAALDFLGVIKLVTEGLSFGMDQVNNVLGPNERSEPGLADGATKKLTVRDTVNLAEHLCKVINLNL